MKTGKFTGFALAVLGAVILAPAAHATCASDVSFGNFPTVGLCGGGSCYVVSPGQDTLASQNASFFWIIGKGSPTIGVGNDNGSYKADGTSGTKPWLIGPYSGGWQMNSGWSQGTTDGCGNVGDTMAGAFFDTSADGLNAYYAVSLALRVDGRGSQFDFGAGNANIALQAIPKPTITATSRTGNAINVTVTWSNNTSAAFTPNEATSATPATAITGFSVYSREVPRGNAAPTDRTAGNWVSRATVAGAAANTASFTFTCNDVTGSNAYLALGVNFDSGFTSPVVGAASTRIECNPTLAEPGSKFKIVNPKAQPKQGIERP